jgi:hypothetical protein
MWTFNQATTDQTEAYKNGDKKALGLKAAEPIKKAGQHTCYLGKTEGSLAVGDFSPKGTAYTRTL